MFRLFGFFFYLNSNYFYYFLVAFLSSLTTVLERGVIGKNKRPPSLVGDETEVDERANSLCFRGEGLIPRESGDGNDRSKSELLLAPCCCGGGGGGGSCWAPSRLVCSLV